MTHSMRATVRPASAIQQRLWQHAQRHPDDAAYNETLELCIPGPVDEPRLRQCLAALTARHAALRTVFAVQDEALWQHIEPTLGVPVLVEDVSRLASGERVPAARRIAQALARVPFDLARTPLLRVLLVRLADDAHRLYLTLHHAICDARSRFNLALELAILYDARTRGLSPVLPPLPVQYADVASSHATPPLGAPLAPSAGARQPVRIPATLADAARALAAAERTTVGTVLLAAWHTLLYQHGWDDATTATVASPRIGRGHAHVVGPMFDVLPIATRPGDALSFSDLLADTRDALGHAADDETTPLDPAAPTAGFLMIPAAPRLAGKFSVDLLAISNGGAKHDLQLVMQDDAEGGFSGYIEYRTAAPVAPDVPRLAHKFAPLLALLADEPRPFHVTDHFPAPQPAAHVA